MATLEFRAAGNVLLNCRFPSGSPGAAVPNDSDCLGAPATGCQLWEVVGIGGCKISSILQTCPDQFSRCGTSNSCLGNVEALNAAGFSLAYKFGCCFCMLCPPSECVCQVVHVYMEKAWCCWLC